MNIKQGLGRACIVIHNVLKLLVYFGKKKHIHFVLLFIPGYSLF